MSMKDRKTLKNYFKKGFVPSEANFENLIDSGINKIDDGFSKTSKDGLMISGIEGSDKLLSFYESIEDEEAQWVIALNHEGKENKNDLQINSPSSKEPVFTLHKEGRIGINKAQPKSELDVNGWIHSKGRAGSYTAENTVPADGKWHPITPELNHCQAFEIVARTGVKGTGKHAVIHAIAVSAYGNSHSKIRKTRSCYNFWKPVKLMLRWTGSTYAYKLEIRCKQNLGKDVLIKYFLTHLWSDEVMGIDTQFRDVDNSSIK